MKITDVTLTLFAWEGIPPTTLAAHTGRFSGSSDLGLLSVETDEGLVGHAFLGSAYNPGSMDGPTLIRFLKPLLIGKDPLDREQLNQAMWKRVRTTTVRSIGAVDVALWDIAGKAAGLPIHRLIGTYRDRIPVYASSPIYETMDQYTEEALKIKAAGWHAYKIHPPSDWKKDIEVCERVRTAVGDDYTLMLDSVWSYSYPDALRVGKAIEALDYYWYEDPLSDQDIYNYQKLKQQLHIPIVATEQPFAALDSYPIWLTSRATDYLRGDVHNKGGITACLKAAHLAEAFRMNYEIHHGNNSLNNVANLHLTMAIKNTEFFEVLLPDGAQKYGLVQDLQVDAKGFLYAPTKPGLGAEIDFELITRMQKAVLA